jgi:tetratricopeptide (TPR) repeat protein
LDVITPEFDSAKDPLVANVEACSSLIDQFVAGIAQFQSEHLESAEPDPRASRVKEALGRARNPNVLYHLAVDSESTTNSTANITIGHAERVTVVGVQNVYEGISFTLHEVLTAIRDATAAALRDLADGCVISIFIDEVDKLDGTSAQDWLRALLRQLPARRIVTARHPGSPWHQDQPTQVIKLENMSLEEVGAYMREKGLPWTDEDVHGLFGYTQGHGLAVATWCDLALHDGAASFADLADAGRETMLDGDFASVVVKVQAAIDQIAVDVLGRQAPLSGLLAISERVTPGLIAMLPGDGSEPPSETEASEIYDLLASRAFIAATDPKAGEGIRLHQAIRGVAWQQLRKDHPSRFTTLQSVAERYERGRVDLDHELKPKEMQTEPFAAWTRFEQRIWVAGVERWLGHAQWLDSGQFQKTKPALVKIYLDAFWWWDDYFRSKASSDLGTALRKVADQQDDLPWMNNLEKFSAHWVASWDEAVLRADPGRWQPVLDSIIALLSEFNLEPRASDLIPSDLTLRRIYILLLIFYAKARWYARDATEENAENADAWLAAALDACQAQPGDQGGNPNGWIGSWVRLRRAEIWAPLDRDRAIGYLADLDRQAIANEDDRLRIGVAMAIGDLWWRSGEFAHAMNVYSRAILLSYAYNGRQEKRRKAANLYTKSLYESSVRLVEEKFSQLTQDGDPEVVETIDTALADVKRLFQPYWDRMASQPDPPPEPPRFKLPVPPSWPGDTLSVDTQYFTELEALVAERTEVISEPIDPPSVATPT